MMNDQKFEWLEACVDSLARKLRINPRAVNQIVDLRHAANLDAIDQVLSALGRRLEWQID